jgi:hypothetical protein
MYVRWAALSIVATGLVTDLDDPAAQRSIASLGAQADIRLVTLSHLDSTFSVGWGVAEGEGLSRRSEWMFSFKIM